MSEIYNKTNPDGTIEYYNKKPQKTGINNIQKSKFDRLIVKIANKNNIDPFLIKCIIKVESDFNPDAVSAAGAMGLMQLMQETARYYVMKDPLDPEENLNAGIKHFKSLMVYFKNDIPLALAAYHAGLGIVKKTMALPPIDSTIQYVKKIMTLYNGEWNYPDPVTRLYMKIDREGDIIIYGR